MRVQWLMRAIMAASLLAAALPSSAHHTFAMFDFSKEFELKGTVESFQWTNPHVWLALAVEEKGRTDVWELEAVSTPQLIRVGWKSNTLKKGDKITVSVRPLKSGEKGGQLVDVTLADGTFLSGGGIPGKKGGKGVLHGLGTGVPQGQPPAEGKAPAAPPPAGEQQRSSKPPAETKSANRTAGGI